VAGGEVRAGHGDHDIGAADGGGDGAGVEDVAGEEDLGLLRGQKLRRNAVDGSDLVVTLGGEGHDMGADAAGGSEYDEVHNQGSPPRLY